MSIQSPLTSSRRSLSNQTIKIKGRPARLFVLLGLMTLAVTALAATASSSSLRQFIFGAAVSGSGRHAARPKAALTDPLLTAAETTSGSSTMTVERRGHTAIRLPDGRVLIAGGENGNGVLNQCDIYDPGTGSFTVAGNMNSARADQTATLLSDGRVLIAGGRDASGAVITTEIFDPGTGTFAAGPNMSVARAGHSATLFADGRVLIAGGDANGSAEILDAGLTSSSPAGSMNDARSMHSAVLLQDGRVLIVGGRDAGGNELSSGEIFDGSNFIGVGGMEDARVRPLLRVLFDGKVQIIGGNDHRSLEIYDPVMGIFGGHAHAPPDGDLHPDLINEMMASPSRAALLTGGQTITELTGSNQALVAGGVDDTGNATSAATTYASSLASISTDKIDYLPGTPVLITGRGFQPNETVTLTFHEDPHVDTAELHSFTVQADADGNFTFDQYSPEAADLGITYILGAKGQTSGWTAQTTFHDNVSVTAPLGGVNVSADKAANAASPAFTALGNIVITEGATTDFADTASAFKTLILTAPSGWTFNPGVGSASGATGSRDIVTSPPANGPQISVSSSTITVSFQVSGTTKTDTLTISGIQVRATDGANIPSSGSILRTSGNPGTATIAGITNDVTNFGSLSQQAGAVSKLVVTLPGQTFADGATVATSGNSGSPTAQTAGTAFNISNLRATDQFFNVVTSYTGAKTISYSGPGSNAGFAAPSYTTAVSFTSGVSTTTLATTLRKAETTTITASDGTTTGPASSTLTVNTGALSGFAVTNTSDGNIITQTAGTAFDITVRAVDSGGNTDTTFNANGFKVNITPSSGTLSAGGGTTDAFVNGVLSSWSVTFSTSGSYPGSFSLTATGLGANSGITGTSNSFTVSAPACTTPSVTTQPTGQSITYGASTSFTAAASGTPTPTIQWQVSTGGGPFTNLSNVAPYSGVTTGTLTITTPAVSLSGNQYRAAFTNTCATVNSNAASLTVSPKALTEAGLSASNKMYDATTAATLTGTATLLASETLGTGTTSDGKPYTGDVVSVTGTPTGTFASKDVANGIGVTVTGTSLTGTQAGNYTLTQQTGLTANITPKALSVSGLSASNKIYDATTAATLTGTAALQTAEAPGAGTTSDGKPYTGDTVSIGGTPSGTFASKDVANGIAVTISGNTIGGAQAGNYTIIQQAGLTANITPKALTVSGLSASNKTYDATTTATLTGTAALQAAEAAGAGTSADGKPYTGDTVTVGGTPSGTFASKDVDNGIAVTVSGNTIGGAQAGNYSITQQVGLTANITPKALTVSGLTASDKIYDATTAATLSGTAALQTAEGPGSGTTSDGKPYSGDTVTISGTPSGTFASANVGNGISVTVSGSSLSGAQAGNYSVTQQTGLSANITPKALTVSGLTANNKPYDATASATLSGTAGLLSSEAPGAGTTSDNKPYTGDTVSVTGTPSGTFASANVANGINVSVSGLSLSGGSAGNYSLTALTLSADINPATLTASITGDPTKTYNGNANATLTSSNFSLSGLASGESFTVTKTSGTYNSPNVASATTVTTSLLAGDFTPGPGTLASNYTLPTTANGAGHITAAHPTLTASGGTFSYDGNPHASTGTAKGVDSITDVSGSFTYTYTPPGDGTAPTNASITPYQVSAAFTSSDSNYDNGTPATNSITIDKASSTTTVTCPTNVTYTGSALEPCTATATGAGSLSVSVTVVYANNTNAGTATADATYTGDPNHNGSSDSKNFEITKADTTTVVTCPVSETYTGAAITPCTVAVTGANLSLAPAASYSNNINVGTATASYTYVPDGNHNGSSDSKNFEITKATSTTVIDCSPGSFTYTGSAITPCTATVTRVGDANTTATLTYANNVNVGNATANASYGGDANHTGSTAAQVTFAITQAASTTTITCPTNVTYNGSPQTPCSATATGVGGLNASVTVVYGNNTNAGTATADATYLGDSNHSGSTAIQKSFTIDSASSSVTVNCPATTETYTGSPLAPCTASYSTSDGLSGSLTVNYTDNTNAGTAHASATYPADANHSTSSNSSTFTISQASSTTTITCPASVTYTGSALTPCTAEATGAGMTPVDLTASIVYGNNTNAGTATADASWAGDSNHTGSTATQNTFTIDKASSTTTITCPANVTYTGLALTPCSAAATGAGMSPVDRTSAIAYANNTNAGTATADASWTGDANHNGSTATQKTFTIDKANQTITWTNPLAITYGTALSSTELHATVAGVPGGSPAGALTYTPATGTVLNAGPGQTLAVDAAATSNYNTAHKTVTIDVNKKPLSITADNQSMIFGGTAPTFTATDAGYVPGESRSNLGGTLTFTVKTLPLPGVVQTVNATTPVGTYAIIPGGLTSSNYQITFNDTGRLTVGAWSLTGFYQPVDMIPVGVLNTIKGGSTVPMKFNIFAGGVENKNVSAILSFQFQEFTCGATGSFEAPIEVTTTGGTSLRYDTTAGQFIENWQTPKPPNKCYQVRMTALDGSHLDAFFKTK
jgi:phosphotransferase system IIA component